MSKYVKDLITGDLRKRLDGVNDALLVDVVGMPNNENVTLRRQLREKQIELLVVKNSLARRATADTPLEPAMTGVEGTVALVWGCEDVVTLAKEVMRLAGDDQFAPFAPKGGVMDGQQLSADEVKAVSKWPGRDELLSLIAGQVTGVGSDIASQLTAPAQQLASQIEKLIEMKEQSGE